MSENTGIRIETVKEVNGNGEQGYRITKIEALTAEDLPEAYTKGERPIAIMGTGWADPENRLFLYEGKKIIYIANWSYIWRRFYTAEDMKKINGHIKAAGQHLADVNAHLAKEREAWHGNVTFVDGVEIHNEKTKRLVRPWEPWLQSSKSAPDHKEKNEPIKLAKKIAELWRDGKLLYRNDKGHIKPLKPIK